MTRVLLVDDHPVVLRGLSSLIASDEGLELIGVAGTVAEAIALAVAPDVAVIDLHLPDGDGIRLGAELKARWPELRVLILTMNADSNSVVRSLGAGLDGYLLKDADPEELLSAIHSAANGLLVLGRGASEAVVRATYRRPAPMRWPSWTRGRLRSSRCSSMGSPRRRWRPGSSWRRKPSSTASPTSWASSASTTGRRPSRWAGLPVSGADDTRATDDASRSVASR